jgi:hypothetical protein
MDMTLNSTMREDQEPALNTFTDVQDDLSWVMHHVQSLGLKCEESDITPAMVDILHSLFSEVISSVDFYCHFHVLNILCYIWYVHVEKSLPESNANFVRIFI